MTQIVSFTLAVGLAQLFSAFTLYLYTKELGPEKYSIVATSESVVLLFQVVIALSLEKAIQRFSLEYSTSDLAFSSAIIATITSMLLLFLCFLVDFFYPVDAFFYMNKAQIMMLIISAYGYALSGFYLSKYQFDASPINYFLISFLRNFVFFVSSYFLLLNNFDISSYYISGFLSAIAIFIFVVIKLDVDVYFKNLRYSYDLIIYSAPFAVSAFCSWLLNWSNRIFFVKTQSADLLGLLSASQKYAMIFFVFTQGVALVATPKILLALNDNDHDLYIKNVKKFNLILIFLGVSAMIFLPFFLNFLLDTEYSDSINILPLFIAVYLFSIVTSLSMANYMVFLKKSVQQMRLVLLCSLIAVVLYLSIIKSLSLIDLMLVILIPIFLLDVFYIAYAKYLLKLSFPYLSYFLPSITILIFTALFTFIKVDGI